MDTQRIKPTQALWKKYWYLLAIALCIIVGWKLSHFLGDASYMVEQDKLVTAKVERGLFEVNVRATGLLKPVNIRWVSAQVSGRIEQVFVKAGAKVQQGDVLVQLSNPEIKRELEKARWELQANNAESHAAYISLESQMLDVENSVLAAEYNYLSAKLKLDAETALMAKGNATVSALDYQKSQLTVKQQQQFWLAQQQKVLKMEQTMAATKTAHQARLGLMENNYQRVLEQVEALAVKASTAGIVQQVSLALGERTQVGSSVALIADQTVLFAELQVQEVRVKDISLGQLVSIDTRTSKISGEVSRINPAVESGMVQVDVKIVDQLPPEARPELTVDGLIVISRIDDALFVKRPVYAPSDSEIGLYKITSDQQFANKQTVKLGQSSVNKIQVLSGLALGDEIIISDTTSWQEHQQVLIN
ncbi:MAG: HlyD family secretion protein [Paraglaciecola sp.]|jgi:HlyD family secretion protein